MYRLLTRTRSDLIDASSTHHTQSAQNRLTNRRRHRRRKAGTSAGVAVGGLRSFHAYLFPLYRC
jgi:hypothetical protein